MVQSSDLSDDHLAVLTVLAGHDQPIGHSAAGVAHLLSRAPFPIGRTTSEVGALLAASEIRGLVALVTAVGSGRGSTPVHFVITGAGRLALS
jgi:hypothetical protein